MHTIIDNLRKTKEQLNLTDLDIILIELWYEVQPKETIIDLTEDSLTKIIDTQAEAKVYRTLLRNASKRIWKKGSLALLQAIINQKSFNIGFMQDQLEVLPKEMLPRFSSFDKISIKDPRANIAKQLGATIEA